MIEFWTICSANSIIMSKQQIRAIERYRDELLYWNEKVNLISRKDIINILVRHLLHSLTILKYVEIPQRAKCLDVGTGGGLPGIPLKIARPDLHMLLVDSMEKKVKMAEMFAKHTSLKNIHVKLSRAEELSTNKEYIGHFDYIFSRAVAPIFELVNWTKKISKKNAKYVFLKGGDLTEEITEAKHIFPRLVIKEQNLSIFGADWFQNEDKKIIVCSFEENR